MRKGYKAEYTAKLVLVDLYGERNVLKLAIGQAADFIVLVPGENKLKKIVEVKTTKGKYYKSRDKDQHERIVALAQEHGVRYELWKASPGRKREIEIIWQGR